MFTDKLNIHFNVYCDCISKDSFQSDDSFYVKSALNDIAKISQGKKNIQCAYKVLKENQILDIFLVN